ncbi:MAG TPA: hypothetical protein VFX12_11835 [Vicinamibacterales bacterium]|nr:hypothetical protein [Vicinamibacterales bacterium]
MRSSRTTAVRLAALTLAISALCFSRSPRAVTESLPGQLTDRAFWSMSTGFSEPGGYFRSDNLVSNETAFQHVIPTLLRHNGSAGAYLGVGPDQNFTYIVALHPRVAFIVDIRRENLLLHLMYKAVIEQSPTRVDFVSRLFSRRRPAGVGPSSTAAELFDALDRAPADQRLYDRNLKDIVHQLVNRHGFKLSPDDVRGIDYVYRAFFSSGPGIAYSFPRGGWARFPTYRELMSETDGNGMQRSYLATEANYRVLREYERSNLIVPVVGDFAGPRALRAVGAYLRDHGTSVEAFYTSNVEQYLFRGTEWQEFYANVASLPIDGESTFIRASFMNSGYWYPSSTSAFPSATLLNPIATLLDAVNDGRIRGYEDVIGISK